MATFTRKQQNKDNKAVKTTQSTFSPTIHMTAHQWRSQHQVLEAETYFATKIVTSKTEQQDTTAANQL